jgi:hypothetical protein
MAGDAFKKVQPDQRLEITAEAFNAFLDAARAVREHKQFVVACWNEISHRLRKQVNAPDNPNVIRSAATAGPGAGNDAGLQDRYVCAVQNNDTSYRS